MKDQVDMLQKRGVKAASLDSTIDAEMARVIKHDAIAGKLKLLYVAPERYVRSLKRRLDTHNMTVSTTKDSSK